MRDAEGVTGGSLAKAKIIIRSLDISRLLPHVFDGFVPALVLEKRALLENLDELVQRAGIDDFLFLAQFRLTLEIFSTWLLR